MGVHQSQAGSDGLVQFVGTKGTQVAGRRRDKAERIAETVCDLELACEGAFSLTQRTARSDRGRRGAALARACSVFLRKMVIGDWNDPSTRLLDDSVVRTFGIGFDRLRRITGERRTIEVGMSFQGGIIEAQKLDEATGRPEATVSLPIAPHALRITVEWPLPGAPSLTEMAEGVFQDSRTGKNGWHGMTGQFRQSVFGRLGGYDDVNDADRLGRDPAMRWLVGGKAIERQAASTSQMGRFETELLATDENVEALVDMNGVWIDKVHDRHPPKMIILDMDSSVSPTHGEQEGTAYNGHFGCTCYHPLFLFNQFGDLERCSLRPGNVHSADGWRNVLEPVVMRYKERKVRLYFRGDAAFASPEIYEYLEAEGLLYVIRLKANAILQRNIAHLLTRPVGRPPDHVRRFHASFSYQAGSWNKKRRVVAKVEWHPGELVPRVGFIVTNLSRPTKRVVAFYNHRGTAEQHIKEGKNAINWTRLSCRKFRNNAVRLQLHALAYNLGNFMRTLALPKEVEHWSMTTLRDKLVKIGAKASFLSACRAS